jgi:DNA mismatch endonuclease (patch repair protein)
MTDIFEPAKRSEIMSRIKGKNTKVELLVYSYLRKNRIYFQKHYRTKFGIRLDVALPRKKKAVFIDGDFWHGRTLDRVIERRGEDDFWAKKLKRNIERDREQARLLTDYAWTFIRVWERDITKKSTQEAALKKIKNYLIGL